MFILLARLTASVMVLFCGNGHLTEIIIIVYEVILVYLVHRDIYLPYERIEVT